MKSLLTLLGFLLVIGGIAVFGYQQFSYTKRETVAQFGNVQLTADTEKTITFPPYTGGVALLAGVVLIVAGRYRK